jgi:serine/threonine-protein kinase RsbT
MKLTLKRSRRRTSTSVPGRFSLALSREVPILAEGDIVMARCAVRETANAAGFGRSDTTRLVTAASELARNVIEHAGIGVMRVGLLDVAGRRGIEIDFEDQGPGIADLDRAMEEGFSTIGGTGMGLPGARHLMDEMNISTKIGVGTIIHSRKWCPC